MPKYCLNNDNIYAKFDICIYFNGAGVSAAVLSNFS